jgi:hypothetical protein
MNANIKVLREYSELEEDDSSQDEMLLALPPMERMEMIAGWHLGDPSWANQFKQWFENQGLYLTTNKDADGVI